MLEIEVAPYRADQFQDLRTLWSEAFPGDPPWNSAEIAIPAKLLVQPELFLTAVLHGAAVGSIVAGYDGHRGWLYALAVSIPYRRRGIGSGLVKEAERRLRILGCNKINLQVRATSAAVVQFYERLGYTVEERISLGKRFDDSL